jgi:hypothetical protein
MWGVVCGRCKNEAVDLWKNILQTLAQLGIYSLERKYMHQKEPVEHYGTTLFAKGNILVNTESQNRNTLWKIGSALTGLLEISL